MQLTKKLVLLLLLAIAPFARGQSILTPNAAGVITVDASTCGLGGAAQSACAFKIALTSNATLTIINGLGGQTVKLFINPGTFTLTWPSNVPGSPSLITGANNAIELQYDGFAGTWYASNVNGIPQVTTNPTCPSSGAFLYFNTVTNQLLQCSSGVLTTATGGWGTVTDAAQFGVKGDGKASCVASFTNASNVVTTLSTEQPFLSSDAGSIAYGTINQCTSVISNLASAVMPLGKICTNQPITAHQVFMCQNDGLTAQNASATCTSTASNGQCNFVWAHTDNTAALQAAWVAASTMPCSLLLLPAGGIYINGLIQNSTGYCQQGVNAPNGVMQGTGVRGAGGQNSTLILLSPATDFTNATLANGGAWFAVPQTTGGDQSKFLEGFAIFGAGLALTNSTAAFGLVGQFESAFQNISLIEFGGTGMTGVSMQGVTNANTSLMNVNIAGPAVPCSFASYVTAWNVFCGGGESVILGSATLNSYNTQFLGIFVGGQAASVLCSGGVVWNSFGDYVPGPTAQSAVLSNGCTINAHGSRFIGGASTSIGVKDNLGGTTIKAVNSTFSGGTNSVKMLAGSTFVDEGGNIFTGAVNNAGGWFGAASVTGTILAASNITPTSGFGTGCATAGQCISAVTGASRQGQFTVTYGTTPSSPQVLTIVFPIAFPVTPICSLTDVGGTNAFPTSIVTTTCTTTGASFTITNTPVGGSTDILQFQAGIP
jgi:hypothetical protein